ncbi:MAG: undecaprenyl/decaprenyl-phosphate alpha-N-acetylglucosaminyl 1-phosphate transferase [Actinomycetota bacterium]|nr:undecaprenyl/decaprenyl-phosphate alpha-N-acetylglucosaminyl 1-phosphate transferase [Actinomycetota bacterium]
MPPILEFEGLPIRELSVVLLVAAVVAFLLANLARAVALSVGAVAWPRARDVHAVPMPRLGGLAILGGVLAGLVLAHQLPALRLAFIPAGMFGWSEVAGVALATVLLVAVGALDDRFELDALTKLAGQITAAGVLVLSGVQWTVIWVPWGGNSSAGASGGSVIVLSQEQGVLITVLLTVALVNALNFIDGLDGLAAGVGGIAALATGAFALGIIARNGNDPSAYSPALLAAVLAGACLGFLPHNFNPARIFMGDSGSMLIGVMLAAATTTASGRIPFGDAHGGDVIGLLAPLIVLAAVVFVPLLDLVLAVVRRTRAGASPFSPDKMHLHHRLLEIGHSHRRAVLLIYLWSAVLAFGAVALALVDDTTVVLVGIGFGLLLAVLASVVPRLPSRQPVASRPAGR